MREKAQACGCKRHTDESGQDGRSTGGNEQGSVVRRPRYLLQFSSSLPSGQSSNPLHRKRPMMQWMPLAQGKKVGPHFDLALAAGGQTRQTTRRQEDKFSDHHIPIPLTQSVQPGPFTSTLKSPKFLTTSTHLQYPARLEAHMCHPPGREWLIHCHQGPKQAKPSLHTSRAQEARGRHP